MTRRSVRLVGLDAASQRSKFGYALGRFDPDTTRVVVEHAGLLGDADDPLLNHIAPFIRGGECVLLAIDAPLGWPDGLRQFLGDHIAAMPPPVSLRKDDCFRRHTDVVVRRVKLPLEVAADRIARAAFEALRVLHELRVATELRLQLVWSPTFEGAASIEVYPGATLAALGLSNAQYKKPDQETSRTRMAGALVHAQLLETLPTEAKKRSMASADVLDAVLCLVAARDFLMGECVSPDEAHADQVRREGWIWARGRCLDEHR